MGCFGHSGSVSNSKKSYIKLATYRLERRRGGGTGIVSDHPQSPANGAPTPSRRSKQDGARPQAWNKQQPQGVRYDININYDGHAYA